MNRKRVIEGSLSSERSDEEACDGRNVDGERVLDAERDRENRLQVRGDRGSKNGRIKEENFLWLLSAIS